MRRRYRNQRLFSLGIVVTALTAAFSAYAGAAAEPTTLPTAELNELIARVAETRANLESANANAMRSIDATALRVEENQKALMEARTHGTAQEKLDASAAYNKSRMLLKKQQDAIANDPNIAAAKKSLDEAEARLKQLRDSEAQRANREKAAADAQIDAVEANARATELARIRAAVAESPPPASATAVFGAAWLDRNNGDTSLQRGLRVQVLCPVVSSAPVVATIRVAIPEWKKDAEDERKLAKRCDDEARDGDGSGAWAKMKREDLESAAKCEAKVEKFQKFIVEARGGIGLVDAHSIIAETMRDGRVHFDTTAAAGLVIEVRTDVDGKYSIAGLPHGKYYLHAKIDTPLMFVEWLAPIDAQGGSIKIDLDNKNAIVIHNFSQ